MTCFKGKMIGVTTFEKENGEHIEIVFTNYNRPPIGMTIYLSLIDKGNWYLVDDFVSA